MKHLLNKTTQKPANKKTNKTAAKPAAQTHQIHALFAANKQQPHAFQQRTKLKTPFKCKLRRLTKALAAGLMLGAALLGGTTAYAQVSGGATLSYNVKQPNNEYTESTIDLRVKVLGGEIKLERTWVNGRWYLNPAWANLRFVADPLDNTVKSIDRVGAIYERSGDSTLYQTGNVYIKHIQDNDKDTWRWYDLNGNWITYDASGRMTGYGDQNNITVTFIRDDQGRLTEIRDPHGETVYTFTYDAQERLTEVKDRSNRVVQYTWEGERLTQVTDVLGAQWRYAYNGDGQLLERTEPDGGKISIAYASSVVAPPSAMVSGKGAGAIEPSAVVTTGAKNRDTQVARVGRVTDQTGSATLYQMDYNKANQQYTITVDDPLGKQTNTLYDKDGRVISRSINGELQTTVIRDGKYRTKTVDARGLATTVERDTNKNPVKIIYPDGSVVTYKYDNTLNKPVEYTNPLGITSAWQYDAQGNMLQYIEAQGQTEARTSQYTYDSYGQPTKITIKGGGSPQDKTTTLQLGYDPQGNISQITDALGNTTKNSFNIQGQIVSVTNALGYTWTTNYDAAGQISSSTDPLGNTVQYTSDAKGRITQVVDALGQALHYSYEYQQGQNAGWKVTQTDALGNTATYQYDAVGHLLQSISPSGDTQNYSYDARGRLLSTTDAAGNITTNQYGEQGSGLEGLIAATLYPSYQQQYRYNALGLPTQITQILSNSETLTTQVGYNAAGQRVSLTDAANRTSQFGYDALGREFKQTDAMGNVTQQSYDALDNITQVTDALGNTHQFEYDGNGRLIQETTPSGQTTHYSYDAANQLTQIVDAQGNTTAYEYDAAGNMIKASITQAKINQAEQTQVQQTLAYSYDAAGAIQQIIQTADINTRFVYERDELGRIVKETITYHDGQANAFSHTLNYTYNADGKTRTITYPDGSSQTYAYEKGQLATVTQPNGKTIEYQQYNWLRPQQIKTAGVTQHLQYDALQRSQEIKVATNNSQATLIQRGYTYDKAGNIIQRNTEQGEYSYSYDLLDRLTQVQPPQALQQSGALPFEGYAYDAVGNRIGSSQQTGTWQYNQDNQLTQQGEGQEKTSYTYTANGNIASETQGETTKTYTYDASDRLIGIASAANGTETEIARYAYDPMGRRIAKTIEGQTTYFLYTDEGLIAELNEQGNLTKAYGWLADTSYSTSPLWQAEPKTGETTISDLKQAQFHTLTTDHLGTVQMATNEAGQVTWKAQSEAFGQTTLDEKNQITMNLRFPGQYFDEETGTHYNYFRDYNPSTGRYIQRDPIGLDGGFNLYLYTNSNPLLLVDPLGLESCSGDITELTNEPPTGACSSSEVQICKKVRSTCQRSMGPSCYGMGTPCMLPCMGIYVRCTEFCRNEESLENKFNNQKRFEEIYKRCEKEATWCMPSWLFGGACRIQRAKDFEACIKRNGG